MFRPAIRRIPFPVLTFSRAAVVSARQCRLYSQDASKAQGTAAAASAAAPTPKPQAKEASAGAPPKPEASAAPKAGEPTPSPPSPYKNLLVETRGKVAVVTLNRPKALNALCDELMSELEAALNKYDADPAIGAIVLTGSKRAFAAGADIKEMSNKTYMEQYKSDSFVTWDNITRIKKPIVAAVSGYALGGGCELAMMCDIIVAAESAKFGQPEIKLGTIPGAGGTQRLIRAVGKSKAMEMILTGRNMDAKEAEIAGLVSKVVPDDTLLDAAVSMATLIAQYSKPIVAMAKECINEAYESSLKNGLHFERRLFHSTFSTKDQKEGMKAFIENRPVTWSDN